MKDTRNPNFIFYLFSYIISSYFYWYLIFFYFFIIFIIIVILLLYRTISYIIELIVTFGIILLSFHISLIFCRSRIGG